MPKPPPSRAGPKGFTLIESVLALGLTAILATSATPIFIDVNRQAQQTAEQGVVSHVQTGISLQQMESLGVTGQPTFPSALDSAPSGVVANGFQPFFNNVLSIGVTSGWRKEDTNRYRSPTGVAYIYNPEDGSFNAQGTAGPGGGGQNLGNQIFSYAGIVFYDSGAIVDTTSKLAYVPSTDAVTLTLASGTEISTMGDHSAVVTLSNGETLKVADIHKPNFFKLSPDSENADQSLYNYLWIEGGQASEGGQKVTYLTHEHVSDSKTGRYKYVYDLDGEYSGGSLKKEYGYIYRTNYKTDKPQSSEGSWVKKENGDYEGTMKHNYKYESESHYGYNHPEAKYRYAFKQEGETSGDSETKYTYDSQNQIYANTMKGKHEYKIDHDSSNGKFKSGNSYDYDGTSQYDKKNEKFESETRYRYKDGRDITQKYEYDQKTKEYVLKMIDNKTGKEKIYTNRKKEG